VWSPHQEVHSAWIASIKDNFIRFALRGLGWTTQPLPPYESRCLLLGLEVLSDRRKIAAALFVRDILCGRIELVYLADFMRFESIPYPRRRNARLMDFYHRTNYGQNEQVNKAILIFNAFCDLFGFCDDKSRCVFRNGFSCALSEERSLFCDCNNIFDVPWPLLAVFLNGGFFIFHFSYFIFQKTIGVKLISKKT
jgi:hypothetical protein